MKFNYDYFTGSISEATFVDLLATRIKSELIHFQQFIKLRVLATHRKHFDWN